MAVRRYDPGMADILPPAACAGRFAGKDLGVKLLPCPHHGGAAVWCRGCNLAYCTACTHPARHACPVLARVVRVNALGRPLTPDSAAWLRGHGYRRVRGRWVYP